MTDADKAALRALAEKATPGPWQSRGKSGKFLPMDAWEVNNWAVPYYSYAPIYAGPSAVAVAVSEGDAARENTDYIAAAHPAAVLSLLDEVERLREALRFYSGHHAIPNDGPWGVDSRDFGAVARAALEPRT